MKIIILLLLTIMVGCSVPTEYGQGIDQSVPVKKIADVLDREDLLEKVYTFEGTVNAQCETDGCWLNLDDEGSVLYVDMNPGGFTLPPILDKKIKITARVVKAGSDIQLQASGAAVYE